jgi:hypothetical protein
MKYNFVVKEINKYMVVEFVQKFHYSPVFPKITKHWLGVFNDDVLVGTLTLGWGTQPKQTIKKVFPTLDTQDYLEIGKMCMSDDMPKNSESQMLSAVIKWLKENKPDLIMLYTMADGIMGKCGYVYQSANFLYGGEYWTDVYMTKDGEKVHPRSVRDLLAENAKFSGKERVFWFTPDFMKTIGMRRIRGKMFRYMYPLNKRARKLLLDNGWNIEYPKDFNLSWKEQIEKGKYVTIERPEFTFENAVINKKNIEQYCSTNLEQFFME